MSTLLFSILFGLFIGLALSIDSFIFSLIYGVTLKRRKEVFFTSLFVGFFHAIFPIIGYLTTKTIIQNVLSFPILQKQWNHFSSFILILLGSILFLKPEEESPRRMNNQIISQLIFAITVSMDGFFIGIILTNQYIFDLLIICLLFFIVSGVTTLIGLQLASQTKRVTCITNLNALAGIIFVIFGVITLILN